MNDSTPVYEVGESVWVSPLEPVRDGSAISEASADVVVSLTPTPTEHTTHHHPLVDGLNYQQAFSEAVESVREALALDLDVLVHCRAGVSRSPAVAATALAAEHDREFSLELEMVTRVRREADPVPALRWHARHYLGERSISEPLSDDVYDVSPATVLDDSTGGGSPLDRTDSERTISPSLDDSLERHDGG